MRKFIRGAFQTGPELRLDLIRSYDQWLLNEKRQILDLTLTWLILWSILALAAVAIRLSAPHQFQIQIVLGALILSFLAFLAGKFFYLPREEIDRASKLMIGAVTFLGVLILIVFDDIVSIYALLGLPLFFIMSSLFNFRASLVFATGYTLFGSIVAILDALDIYEASFQPDEVWLGFAGVIIFSMTSGITLYLIKKSAIRNQQVVLLLLQQQDDLESLNTRLKGEIDQRMVLQDQLRHQAVTDPLTDSLNRRGFFALLDGLSKDLGPLACFLIDVDHLKAINDNHGHLAGDRALMHVAQSVRANLRDGDIFARYGGDEFIVLMRGVGEDRMDKIAGRIRRAMTDNPLPLPGGDILVRVSIGGVIVEELLPYDTWIAVADRRLYEAKHQRRDQSVT